MAENKGVAAFYADRTVTIAVGFSAGGNYDRYARLVAKHIGRHIPGQPAVVVTNVTGAGSRRLANTLATLGPHDGTTIGLPNQGIPTDQAIGAAGVQYDARRFNWIGSPAPEINVLWAWHRSPVTTVAQAKQQQMIVGSTGPGSPTHFYPQVMNMLIGTKFKIVTGYPGSSELDAGIEQGEVNGRVVSWSSLKRTRDWYQSGKAVMMVQIGLQRAPELADVPLAQDFVERPADRKVLEFLALAPALGRPFFMSPLVPAHRVAAMRAAFAATMADKDFLAEAAAANLVVDPLSGDALAQIVTRIFESPPDVIKVAKSAME